MLAITATPVRGCSGQLPDWRELCNLSNEELGRYDIAAVNLACAVGLPGSEVIDAAGCLNALDSWAVGIRRATEHALKTVYYRDPARYDHSEPLFRMVKLALTLRNQCGVYYNPAKIGAKPDDPFDLDEQYIYGAIQGPGGTCATLPMVYAAVGRRLGYPIKLVLAKNHLFCRWEDPITSERVNIEGTNLHGVDSYSDDYYRKWPYPISAVEEEQCRLLKSLTPREELATFIYSRGTQWRQAGNFRRAIAARAAAALVDPTWKAMWGSLRHDLRMGTIIVRPNARRIPETGDRGR